MNKKSIVVCATAIAGLAILLAWIICQKIDKSDAKIVKQLQDIDELKKC